MMRIKGCLALLWVMLIVGGLGGFLVASFFVGAIHILQGWF